MTVKEATEWLSRGYRIKERIKVKQKRIQMWRDLSEVITPMMKAAPTAPSMPSRKVEKYAINIADMEMNIQKEIWALMAVEQEISAAIEKYIEEPAYKELLERRFLCGNTYEQISIGMGYSYRWVLTMKDRAIEEFSKKAC